MPGEIDRNQIDSEGRGRSMNKGDVPEPLRRRYYLDERGGPGLGFYADARIQTAAFRDLGARLVTPRSDPNAIRDMAAVAQHRGWTVVVVHGGTDFRREAWLMNITPLAEPGICRTSTTPAVFRNRPSLAAIASAQVT